MMRLKDTGRWWIVPLLSLAGIGATGTDLPLVQAVKEQNKEAVRALLAQRVDVNAVQADGSTALHWAVSRDNQENVDLLLRAGASVNVKNELGATPLWLACTHGSAAMIERLLKAGADPNAALPEGETPIMTASRTGTVDAVRLLLAHGANVNAKEGARGQTALMWAVAERHPEAVRALLEHGADVHARSSVRHRLVNIPAQVPGGRANPAYYLGAVEEGQGGFTPLLFAARQGDLESARLLVAAGANVNDAAPNGASALVVAAHSGHGSLAAFLLDKGADPNVGGAGYTALHAAVLRGDLALVNALLTHGANPDTPLVKGTPARRASPDWALSASWVGATPFWLAAKFSEVAIMQVLAAHGADPLLPKEDGATPLMAAAQGESPRAGADEEQATTGASGERERLAFEAVKLALDLGADVNASNVARDTALHIAASRRLNTVVQLLADKGAKLDAKNKRGQTPLAMTAPRAFNNYTGADPGGKTTADLLRHLGAKE